MSFPFRDEKVLDGAYCRRADNVKRLKRQYKRLVWSALHARNDLPYFVTLTFRDNVTELAEAYTLFQSRMRVFKRKYNIEYIGVPEFQKKGRVHFHVLMWGDMKRAYFDFLGAKAEYLADRRIYGNEAIRRPDDISETWGLGFVDIFQCTNRSSKIGSYMAKYMTKDSLDQRTYGQKSYTRSRMALQVEELWSYGVIPFPVGEVIAFHMYDTKYLGEGVYILLDVT